MSSLRSRQAVLLLNEQIVIVIGGSGYFQGAQSPTPSRSQPTDWQAGLLPGVVVIALAAALLWGVAIVRRRRNIQSSGAPH